MNEVKDKLEVKMNFANAQDHVPEAEWNNRTIKEQRLAMNQVSQLNLFPVKGGISTLQPLRDVEPVQFGACKTLHCATQSLLQRVQANHEAAKTSSNVTRCWMPALVCVWCRISKERAHLRTSTVASSSL